VFKARTHGNRKKATTAHAAQTFSHLQSFMYLVGVAKLPFNAPATNEIKTPNEKSLIDLAPISC
jgi:hypothetical protein